MPIPTMMLAALFLIGNVGVAVCAAYSRPVPPGFLVLYTIGLQWGLAWWVIDDCRKRGVPASIDHGWFVFFAWPVVFPYHLFKTRGLKGFRVLFGLVALFVGSYLVALIIWVALSR